MWKCLYSFIATTVAGALSFSALAADNVKLEQWQGNQQKQPVIVVLKSQQSRRGAASTSGGWLNLADHIEKVQEELADDMGWVNFNDIVKYKHVAAMAKEVDEAEFSRLQQSNLVAGVYADKFNPATLINSSRTIGLNAASNQSRQGNGFSVAIIDSGVEYTHPFLQIRVIDGACFSYYGSCPGGKKKASGVEAGAACRGNEGCFHGTHVAGIVAGANSQFTGVAQNADLLSVNVFSVVGQRMGALDSDIMQALEWVYDHADDYHIAAVNMSLGGGYFSSTCDDQPVKRYIDLLAQRGVVTVIAAGNEGRTDGVASPGCISSAITVGSTEPDGRISAFSNSYRDIDLVAPGGKITSSTLNGKYTTTSGTSMAAPQVAGAVALLRSTYPSASVAELSAALSHGKRFVDPRNKLQTSSLYLPAALEYLAASQRRSNPQPAPTPAKPTPKPVKPSPSPAPEKSCRKVIDGITIEDTRGDCKPEEGKIQW